MNGRRNPFAPGRPWHSGVLVGFDLETTGVDPVRDRVVSAAVAHVDVHGEVTGSRQWLVDPVRSIPAQASAVHGISTARARVEGMPSEVAVAQIIAELESAWLAGLPVVVFNAPYDLTLLDAEAVRHGLMRITDRPWWPRAWVVDPLVVDRGIDRYRRGQRTLAAMADFYEIPPWNAHAALGDAVAACRVARAIAESDDLVAGADAQTLHSAQVGWFRDWAVHLQAYRRSKGDEHVQIDRDWPARTPMVGRHRASEPDLPVPRWSLPAA